MQFIHREFRITLIAKLLCRFLVKVKIFSFSISLCWLKRSTWHIIMWRKKNQSPSLFHAWVGQMLFYTRVAFFYLISLIPTFTVKSSDRWIHIKCTVQCTKESDFDFSFFLSLKLEQSEGTVSSFTLSFFLFFLSLKVCIQVYKKVLDVKIIDCT